MTRAAPILLALALAACPGPAAQPDTPRLPSEGAIPGDQPRPPAPPAGGGEAPVATNGAAPQPMEIADEPFRAEAPAAGKPRPLNIPAIQTFTLDNGLRAFLVERHDLPIIAVDLVFDGGSMNDPADRLGRASVCMKMVSEGTEKLDKMAYNEALADIASEISSWAGLEEQALRMTTLTQQLDRTHALFLDTLLHPGMRPEDFDRLVKQRIEAIRQAKGNVAGVAGRVSASVLYGPDHPFGRVQTEAALAALTLDECKKYATAWLRPQGARLFVAGDMTRKQVEQRFGKQAIAGWTGKTPAPAALPAPRPRAGRIFFVHLPGAEQSMIQLMHFGPKRKAPDFFANTLASQIFGGGFSSRLNMNLREDKGYSYGARGGFNYNRRYGELTAGASVRSDATWQSVVEIWNEMLGLDSGKRPPTAEELARERNGNILGLPSRFATMDAILDAYSNLVYFGLPLDYYKSYAARMQAVTVAQTSSSAKKHLKPENALILIVGDATSLQKQRVVKDGKKLDEPLLGADGKPVTLADALARLVAKGGPMPGGKLILLDADGNVLPQ